MQFDFVCFLVQKKFQNKAKNFAFFSFETSCIEFIFVPLQNKFNKIQFEEILALTYFRTIISKPTELNRDSIRFFTVAAKLCLSILPKVDLYMQSLFFFWRLVKCAPQAGTVDPTFTVVDFGVFSLADFPVYAIAKSKEALTFPSIYLN